MALFGEDLSIVQTLRVIFISTFIYFHIWKEKESMEVRILRVNLKFPAFLFFPSKSAPYRH